MERDRNVDNRLTPLQSLLVSALADGCFHSGVRLGAETGVSRAAVWKALKELQRFGLHVQAVSGRGYRLERSLELLDQESIWSSLPASYRKILSQFDLLASIDSTNAYVSARRQVGQGVVCIAEHQSGGRGRRGRSWVSPFGANIYLSLGWWFDTEMGRLAGLSLAASVAVVRALKEFDPGDVAIKWPNDVYLDGRKVAGILLEMAGEATGPCHVVVGIGVNVGMPHTAGHTIDQPWADLATIGVGRNLLAGRLLTHLIDVVLSFERRGMGAIEEEWRAADMFRDQQVVLLHTGGKVHGIACGIDNDGALLLRVDGAIQRYTYGEASVRAEEIGE